MGVFRIARAEFIKIFKKPSVYLMGVILAAVLVLSLLFFDPIGKQNYSVQLDGTTVGQVYDKFTNDNNIAGGDIKKSKFDESINSALTKIDFYKILNERNESLQKVNSEFIVLYDDLVTQSKIENNAAKINETFNAIKNKIRAYDEIYNDIKKLEEHCEFYSHFTSLPIYTNAKSYLEDLKNRTGDDSSATVFINIVSTNKYIEKFNEIYNTNKNFVKSTINHYSNTIKEKQSDYYNRVINNPSSSQEILINLKNSLANEIELFSTNLLKFAESEYSLSFILKNNYDDLNKIITEAKSIIESFDDESNANKTAYQRHSNIVKALSNLTLPEHISSFSNNLIPYEVSTKTLNSLNNTITTRVNELKAGLNESIESLNKNSASKSQKDIAALNDLISSYRVLSINTTALVNNTINLEATKVLNQNKINTFINFEEFNKYEINEELTKTNYFIKNGVYNQNYSDVFAFNKNSGSKTTAYDFIFFSMEIATLIITVFAIFLAASLMASEYDSGTIKLLAMRPFKRWKIITGKLIATMFFVILFVIFSFLISLVAGVCLYPLGDALILSVFNSSGAFIIHPMLLMLINIGCILLEIFFYTVIALSISTIFRSYTGAISASCIMFILALSLNMLFGGAYWYSFIPFINADFFKYLGGSFLTTQSGALNQLFTPTLLTNANFYISLGIYGGTVLLFLAINYIVFKIRDF